MSAKACPGVSACIPWPSVLNAFDTARLESEISGVVIPYCWAACSSSPVESGVIETSWMPRVASWSPTRWIPWICSKQAWHITPSEKKSSVLCAYTDFKVIGRPVSRSVAEKEGTALPAGRPAPTSTPTAFARAVSELEFVRRTPGSTKLSAITTTTPTAISPFQGVEKPVLACFLELAAGADARDCWRAALAFLPLIAITTSPENRIKEAADEQEQHRQRDKIRNAVDVGRDVAHPRPHRFLEARRRIRIAGQRERNEQDAEARKEDRPREPGETNPLLMRA